MHTVTITEKGKTEPFVLAAKRKHFLNPLCTPFKNDALQLMPQIKHLKKIFIFTALNLLKNFSPDHY